MSRELSVPDPKMLRAFDATASPEMVGRNCRLEGYKKIAVPSFKLSAEFIAFASPESTYSVTKRLIDGAKQSILIGIYDFTAEYVKQLLLNAMYRGVKVSLMLDLDGRSGEQEIYDDLVNKGCEGVPAPSCASQNGAKFFPSCHERVIVIDGEWTVVQSGNYTDCSIPLNEVDGGDPKNFKPGNRDMGIAIRSKPLAVFLTKVLRSDMQLERNGTSPFPQTAMATQPGVDVLQAAPEQTPPSRFKSKEFKPTGTIEVTPILSPDNYMEAIPGVLARATKSIYVEQQYVRGRQKKVGELLSAIRNAMDRNGDLDVRIIVARPLSVGKSYDKAAKEITDLGKDFGLKLGIHVRILNPKYFIHCHNKLIIVDKKDVLISSQNWSDYAVAGNREAGLLIKHAPIAEYYASIFEKDWQTALKTVARRPKAELFSIDAYASGNMVRLNWGDYVAV